VHGGAGQITCKIRPRVVSTRTRVVQVGGQHLPRAHVAFGRRKTPCTGPRWHWCACATRVGLTLIPDALLDCRVLLGRLGLSLPGAMHVQERLASAIEVILAPHGTAGKYKGFLRTASVKFANFI
jgi:hypothetical protein